MADSNLPQAIPASQLADGMRSLSAVLRRLLGPDEQQWLACTIARKEAELEGCSIEYDEPEHWSQSADWQDHLSQYADNGVIR